MISKAEIEKAVVGLNDEATKLDRQIATLTAQSNALKAQAVWLGHCATDTAMVALLADLADPKKK